MLDELANNLSFPDWSGSRYRNLVINEHWLRGTFYKATLESAFSNETDKYGNFIRMWSRKPSIQLNIPQLAAKLISRKLFAGKHTARLAHDKPAVTKAMKWLVKEARIDYKMLEAAIMGQAGSVGLTFKVIDGVPIINTQCAKYCYPQFDEANKLTELMICYPVLGYSLINLVNPQKGVYIGYDTEGDKIEPNNRYWYIRMYNVHGASICIPPKYEIWNPVTPPFTPQPIPDFTVPSNLGFVTAAWIKNMPGGDDYDGLSTFDGALNNCIHLDYTLSQLGRGINYGASPTVVVKGRIINANGGRMALGPTQMLQLAPDKRDSVGNAVSGADAKMMEMSAEGIQVGMSTWVEKIHNWTQQIMSTNRKDPDTFKGTMSGKAMELLDDDFIDALQVARVCYGEYGMLEAVKILARMLIAIKHPMMAGVTEQDIQELELEWPKLYTASPQEVQFLAAGLAQALEAGLMQKDEAITWFESQIDKRSEMIDAKPEYPPDQTDKADTSESIKDDEVEEAQAPGTSNDIVKDSVSVDV